LLHLYKCTVEFEPRRGSKVPSPVVCVFKWHEAALRRASTTSEM
jgi:hypothetical protein